MSGKGYWKIGSINNTGFNLPEVQVASNFQLLKNLYDYIEILPWPWLFGDTKYEARYWTQNDEILRCDSLEIQILRVTAPGYVTYEINESYLLHYWSPLHKLTIYMEKAN